MATLLPIANEDLFPHLTGKDLLALCQTNQAFAEACRDERVWEERVLGEYNNYVIHKPENISWKKYYILILNSQQIPIYYNEEVTQIISFLLNRDFLISVFSPENNSPNETSLNFFLLTNTEIIDAFSVDHHGTVLDLGPEPDYTNITTIIVTNPDSPIPRDLRVHPNTSLHSNSRMVNKGRRLAILGFESLLYLLHPDMGMTYLGDYYSWLSDMANRLDLNRYDLQQLIFAMNNIGLIDVLL